MTDEEYATLARLLDEAAQADQRLAMRSGAQRGQGSRQGDPGWVGRCCRQSRRGGGERPGGPAARALTLIKRATRRASGGQWRRW